MLVASVQMCVTRPLEWKAFLISAILLFEDFQVTWVVRSLGEESEKVPIAVNCWVAPMEIVALLGVIVMVFRVTVATVRVTETELVTVPDTAVMTVVPAPTDVASPLVTPALLMVATAPFDEFQVTSAVRFWVVLSE